MLDYSSGAKLFKALSDEHRLKIIDLLSCGERCACDLLPHFQFSQPTLSHHMKVLIESGLVVSRKVGVWQHYSLNGQKCNHAVQYLLTTVTEQESCICKIDTQSSVEECACVT